MNKQVRKNLIKIIKDNLDGSETWINLIQKSKTSKYDELTPERKALIAAQLKDYKNCIETRSKEYIKMLDEEIKNLS